MRSSVGRVGGCCIPYPAELESNFACAVSVMQEGGETKPLVRLAPDFKSVLPWPDGSILPVKMTAETFSE